MTVAMEQQPIRLISVDLLDIECYGRLRTAYLDRCLPRYRICQNYQVVARLLPAGSVQLKIIWRFWLKQQSAIYRLVHLHSCRFEHRRAT